MANLTHKIKVSMDESRMLILGASVFLGFDYRAPFEPAFASLPATSQHLKLAGLLLLLVSITLIMSPGAYHRIVWRGNDSQDVQDFATRAMDIALLPFLLTLGIDFYVIVGKFLGGTGGVVAGVLIATTALLFWYVPGIFWRKRKRGSEKKTTREVEMEKTPLKDRVEQVLTEARVVLPGVQALLGFQLATMLMDGFDKLPQSSKYVHVSSLILMGLCVILLMTPASYHRIVERGEDTESFHRLASALLLVVMIPLPLGICGDLFVVFRKVTDSISISIGVALLILLFFFGLWFAFPAYRKSQLASGTTK
ncbi:MAG: hypothetical protein QOH70_3988 [Blastocatellia bacterium]|jgi:hypothetical protein|nr:hypothetical protein [Blastocatellia bacterium]